MSPRIRSLVPATAALVAILACRVGSLPMTEPGAPTPEQPEAAPTQAAPPAATPTAFPLACGEDTACFLQAAASCSPANVTWTTELDMMGMLTTSRTLIEIRGQEGDRCLLYVRTEGGSVTFTPELIDRLRASGLTDEQIAEQQQQANLSIESTQGLEGTCRMAPSDLVAMLSRWQEGRFSTEDWEPGECEGSMFGE